MNITAFLSSAPLEIDRRRQWHPTPVLLPGKSHGRRSLVGCSPWGHKESDTYWVTSLSLSCTGEGNGNPLQCSCLENPRDGKPGGLPSMGSHRVGHNWSDLAAAAAVFPTLYILQNTSQWRCLTCFSVHCISYELVVWLYEQEPSSVLIIFGENTS